MHTTARPDALADRLGAAAAALATEACVELLEEVGLQHDSKLNCAWPGRGLIFG